MRLRKQTLSAGAVRLGIGSSMMPLPPTEPGLAFAFDSEASLLAWKPPNGFTAHRLLTLQLAMHAASAREGQCRFQVHSTKVVLGGCRPLPAVAPVTKPVYKSYGCRSHQVLCYSTTSDVQKLLLAALLTFRVLRLRSCFKARMSPAATMPGLIWLRHHRSYLALYLPRRAPFIDMPSGPRIISKPSVVGKLEAGS